MKITIPYNKFYFSTQDAGVVVDGRLSGACERAVGMRFGGVKYEYDRLTAQILEIGKLLQTHCYNKFLESGNLVTVNGRTTEIDVSCVLPELTTPFIGRIDLVICGNNILGRNFDIEDPAIVDVKSTKDAQMYYITRQPNDSHVIQIVLYLYASGLETGILQYISRDSLEEYWWEIKLIQGDIYVQQYYSTIEGFMKGMTAQLRAPFTLYDILNRYRYLEEKIANHTCTKRDFEIQYSPDRIASLAESHQLSKEQMKAYKRDGTIKKGDYQCLYCPYQQQCWFGTSD